MYRVHIRHLRLNGILVSLLQRAPFGRTQKEPKGPRPIVRPSLRSGSLAPALLRGHAATGHPWPIAALPASMPVDPLLRTSSRPPGRAGRSKSKTAEAADRPACFADHMCTCPISIFFFFFFFFFFCCSHALVQTTRMPLTEGRAQVLLWGWCGRTPRQPRWAMDGPSRRAPITVPE